MASPISFCILCSSEDTSQNITKTFESSANKNTELFNRVCEYLGIDKISVPDIIDFDKKDSTASFCPKCTQLASEIYTLHEKVEQIKNEIAKRVEQIEQNVIALELPTTKDKGWDADIIHFLDQFQQKVKKSVQSRQKEHSSGGQGPPYLHIVEIKPALLHQNKIKIQPEDSDEEEDSFSTDEIEIFPLNDEDSEDIDFKEQQYDDESSIEEETKKFQRQLRPRVRPNQSSIDSGHKRLVKSEPESQSEDEEMENEFNIDPEPEEEPDNQLSSDSDDPEVNFSNDDDNESDEEDSDDEDWGSARKNKKARTEPVTVTSTNRRSPRRRKGAATSTSDNSKAKTVTERNLEKWGISFSSEGRIFYENIEIIKTETKSGFTLKCGECDKEYNIIRGKSKKRESPFYKMKCHIRGSHLGRYSCKICAKAMSCPKSLNRHVERHHGTGVKSDVPKAHCEICEKPFKTNGKDFLFSHRWSHKSEEEKAAAIACGIKPPLTYAEKVTAMKTRNPETFPCSQCEKVFLWKSLLTKHENRVHLPEDQKIKNFACHVCGKLFVAQGDLTAHKRFVCEKDKLARLFFCSLCDKKFTAKDDYIKHQRKHTKEKPFQCPKCTKWYSQEKSLKRHTRDCKGKEGSTGKFYQGVEMLHDETETGFIVKCGCCDFAVENIKAKQARCDTYRKIHLHIQGKHLGAFKCNICDKKLSDPKGLKNHLETHDNNETPKHHCEICGKPFKTNKNKKFLLSHLWTHMSEEERQERVDAGYTPPLSYAERMEMLKSKEDNLFQCDQCGKTFAWQCQLKKHERTHSAKETKERGTHQCSTCGKFYATADSLNSHVKHVHDKDKVHKWHYCTFCDKKYSHKFAWRKHERSHRRDTLKAFQCQVCSKAFSQEKNYNNHIKLCHSNVNQRRVAESESGSSHTGDQGRQEEDAVLGNGIQVLPQQYHRQVVPQSHSSATPMPVPGLPIGHFMVPGMPGNSRFYEEGNIFQNFF